MAARGSVGELWFVPLEAASSAEQVWEAILEALQLSPSPSVPASAQIAARLARSGTSLLVWTTWSRSRSTPARSPPSCSVRRRDWPILATSRRRLGAPGEELIAVGGLPGEDAVGLFLDRARSVVPGFAPGAADEETLRTLIERLEGFPLAIELAAAWVSALSPAEILQQIEAGILSLPAGTKHVERHASLSAAIRWSVALLGAELQRTFFAVSVFRGGWDAAAAESVCGVERDALASLRDRSLITAHTQHNSVRFGMHETLRQYGEQELSPAERDAILRRHAGYFTSLAETADNDRRAVEHANLRTASRRPTRAAAQAGAGAGLVLGEDSGHWREGRAALERVAEQGAKSLAPADRAEILLALGRLCYSLCDYAAVQTHAEGALEIFRERNHDRGMARACLALASLSFHYRPDIRRSRMLSEQALLFFERAGDAAGQAATLIGMGAVATDDGDYELARRFQERSLAIAEANDLPSERAVALWRSGLTACAAGRFENSERYLLQAETLFQERNEPVNLAYVRTEQGVLAQNRGDYEAARLRYEAALPQFRELGEIWAVSICVGNLARLAQYARDYAQASACWRESLQIRVHLQDGVGIARTLDGIASLLFCVAWDRNSRDDGLDAVRLRAASVRLRKSVGLSAAELDEHPNRTPPFGRALERPAAPRRQGRRRAVSSGGGRPGGWLSAAHSIKSHRSGGRQHVVELATRRAATAADYEQTGRTLSGTAYTLAFDQRSGRRARGPPAAARPASVWARRRGAISFQAASHFRR